MINVDGMIAVEGPPGIVYGSVGSNRTLVSGRFDAETVPVGAQIIQAEVLNLRGGHSGADIHLPRLNSVKAFAKLGKHILRTYPGSRIQGVISNSESGLNKIPSSFGATFAVVSAEPAAQISEDLSRFLRELVKSFADEDLTKVQITVQARAVSGKVLNAAASQQVVAALLATPSGLTHQDPKFPNGMRTSSNLGFVSLAPVAETSLLELRAAFMARSYVEPEMDQVVEQSTRALSAAWSGTANPPTTTKLAGYGPWLADQDSWLIRAVLSKVPYFQATYLLSVGLEPSYFKKNYPGLEIISIAPEIRDAHSASERVRIQSVYEITDALDQILQAL
jgi:dipeptidase D